MTSDQSIHLDFAFKDTKSLSLSRQNQIHQRTILLSGSHIYDNSERLRGPLAKQIITATQIIEDVDKLYIFGIVSRRKTTQ